MSKYLDRLKLEIRPPCELPKLSKGGNGSFGSTDGKHISKNQPQPAPWHRPDPPTSYEGRFSLEAERRADFCRLHRTMQGGACPRFNVIENLTPGDRVTALDTCLLWQLVRAGRRIDQVAQTEIVPGVTVGVVLEWVGKDVEAIQEERRLLLTCVEAMGGTLH